MSEEKRGKVVLLFVGHELGTKGKMLQMFIKLDSVTHKPSEEELARMTRRVYSKIKNVGRPGGIFEFDCSADNEATIFPGSLQYVDRWHDKDQIVEWQAESDAEQIAFETAKRRNKETKVNEVFEALEPVRRAYKRSVGRNKQILLAQVIEYITRR